MPEKSVPAQQKSKEMKVFSTQVITLDHVKKDKRKLLLLNIIKTCNEISERGLSILITMLKDEKNINLNYTILKLGNRIIARELQEDIRALLYLGLIEVDPKNKKLKLTSNGQEFLDNIVSTVEDLKDILSAVEELKPRIIPIDEEVSLVALSSSRK